MITVNLIGRGIIKETSLWGCLWRLFQIGLIKMGDHPGINAVRGSCTELNRGSQHWHSFLALGFLTGYNVTSHLPDCCCAVAPHTVSQSKALPKVALVRHFVTTRKATWKGSFQDCIFSPSLLRQLCALVCLHPQRLPASLAHFLCLGFFSLICVLFSCFFL